jgi:tetratricopeptide (TPR) repeat protein
MRLAEELTRVATRLNSEEGPDLKLETIAVGCGGTDSAEAFDKAEEALRDRMQWLKQARKETKRLLAVSDVLREAFSYSDEAWPVRLAELQAIAQEDAEQALIAWLDDWYTSASALRVERLERLLEAELVLPPGAGAILERARSATAGIAQSYWRPADAMLRAGAGSRELPGWQVGEGSLQVRIGLCLALARVALSQVDPNAEDLQEADDALGLAENLLNGALNSEVAILRARLAQLRREDEQAAECLSKAVALGAPALDRIAVSLTAAGARETSLVQLETARQEVESLSEIADIDHGLRLIGPYPPASLLVALSERAGSEGDDDKATTLSERALDAARPDEYALKAALYEQRATIAIRKQDPQAFFANLLEAGDNWGWAGEPVKAINAFEAALDLEPNDPGARLGLADSLRIVSAGQPLSKESIRANRRALDLLHASEGIPKSSAWGNFVEALVEEQLARWVEPDSSLHKWRSLLAASTAVVRQPSNARAWNFVAWFAITVKLYRFALVAGSRAVELDPDDPGLSLDLVGFNLSAGEVERAHSQLESWRDPVGDSSRNRQATLYGGVIAMYQGRIPVARRAFDSEEIPPDAYGIRHLRIQALTISGERKLAAEEAQCLADDVMNLLDDSTPLRAAAFAAANLGKLDQAEQFCAQISAADPDQLHASFVCIIRGLVELLRGNVPNGLEDFRKSVETFKMPGEVNEWRHVLLPYIEMMVRNSGQRVPDLSSVDAFVEQHCAEIGRLDVGDELQRAASQYGPGSLPSSIVALLDVLARWVQFGPQSAVSALDLHAGELLESSEQGLVSVAEELRDAIVSTASAPAFSEVPVESLADEPSSAEDVPYRPIRIELPPGWFSNYEDPVAEHPIFTYYIPQLRARARTEIPGINVGTDEELEPDGYRIFLLGELKAEGRVDKDSYYFDSAALPLLPEPLAAQAKRDKDLALMRLPAGRVDGAGVIVRLVTMAGAEVVVNLVGLFIGDAVSDLQPA